SDSGSYLRPALTWLGGGDYELSIRPIGYPWLLGWVIRLGGLDAIAPVQTVLAMVTAALTLATFRLGFREGWASSTPGRSAALAILCILGMSALLSYQPTTTLSHAIMSETLCGFGVALGLFGLVAAFVFLDDPLRLAGAFVLGTIG